MSIKLEGVTKTFGKTCALDRVSVTFADGKIYGLLGNNGAGKSTMLNLITDRYRPDGGSITVDGAPVQDNDAVLGSIMLVGEQNFFPDGWSVRRAFKAAKVLDAGFELDYALALAKKFGLNAKKKIESLSTGYGTIFRVILALASSAQYLLLDEPVLGLDAQNREMFYRELMDNYGKNPRTFIISTHLIAEVENMIEEAVIVCDGHILQAAPAAELVADAYTVTGAAGVVDAYLVGKTVLASHSIGGLKSATLRGKLEGSAPAGLEFGHPGLQDYFISLMEKQQQRQEAAL